MLAQKIATEALKGAHAYQDKKTLTANMIKLAIVDNAEARLTCARDKNKAYRVECEKELKHSGSMQALREHD